MANRTWEIAPRSVMVSRPAFFLPGQLERVTGMAYTDDPRREVVGGYEIPQGATTGYMVKDVWLLDGRLYKGDAVYWLSPRTRSLPLVLVEREIPRAAVYTTSEAIKFFALWLTDDCTTHALAKEEGLPVTSDYPPERHHLGYESLLGMRPLRTSNAFCRELVFFEDHGRNPLRLSRFTAMRNKLLSQVRVEPHPGVFLLRKGSGKRRILVNELELAEQLRARRGFRVVDVTTADVSTLLNVCAGARVVIGVEGSHLIHGLVVLPPGGSLCALQPPDRFCPVLRWTTDMVGQNYAFTVGTPRGEGFHVDVDEVERTLDLFPT